MFEYIKLTLSCVAAAFLVSSPECIEPPKIVSQWVIGCVSVRDLSYTRTYCVLQRQIRKTNSTIIP